MAVRLVTDSTADLPENVVQEYGITVVPLHIYFGDEHFQDGLTVTRDEFYQRLASPGQPFPRTSAPSSGEFEQTYTRLLDRGGEIVSIHLSQKLSATFASATAARTALSEYHRIEVVDSETASLALGLLVLQAAQMARDGASAKEILRATVAAVPRTRFFGVLETLEYLRRGGRIGRAAALLGSLLQTKPLVGLRNGVAYPIERVRGRRRSLDRIVELVMEHEGLVQLAVGHTTDPAGMQSLAARLADFFPVERMLQAQCGATLGSYLGPGAYGVALIQAAS